MCDKRHARIYIAIPADGPGIKIQPGECRDEIVPKCSQELLIVHGRDGLRSVVKVVNVPLCATTND